jgi:PAS domain S-box-containing protein
MNTEVKKIKILVIDDNNDNIITIKALIKEIFPDSTVSFALSGPEGLIIAEREFPDVILLDVLMPEMDGFEVCTILKKNESLSDIPVIFITALNDTRELRLQALEIGVEAFLTKPINENELNAQIRAMIKIKNANLEKRHKEKRLTALVEEQTRELNVTYTATLNLLEDIRKENEARKMSEEALRESEERYRRITSGLTDYLYTVKVSEGIVVETIHNEACLNITGYSSNEFAADPNLWIKIIIPEERKIANKRFHEILEGKDLQTYEHHIIRKNGEIRWISDTAIQKFDNNGRLISFDCVIKDITERKLAEEEIKKLNEELEQRVAKRTSQLEAANKEMEAFSYSVSHDLRAPLRHINGFADILITEYYNHLPDEAKHYLETISDSAKKMGVLIDDLLSFSRTGRTELVRSLFNMNDIVEDALAQIKYNSDDRLIEWKISPLPKVLCDYNLLRQVWINLIDNALKYSKQKERAIIEISNTIANGDYIFMIKDNGVGFDMKYARKLFGVFQRLHSSKQFEGTGIGLANVQRIILRHGGRVWAFSEINKGAEFYFTIPVKPNE